MEKKLTLARAVLSFCAATLLLAPVVGPLGAANMAMSIDGVTLTAVADSCSVCDPPPPDPGPIPIVGDPPPPDPGPIPIVGDPPKPKATPPSVSIVRCMECEPRPTEGEPMPLPAPTKKEPPVASGVVL